MKDETSERFYDTNEFQLEVMELSSRREQLINKRAKMALYRSPDYQTSFESIDLSVQDKNFNTDFQDGGYL